MKRLCLTLLMTCLAYAAMASDVAEDHTNGVLYLKHSENFNYVCEAEVFGQNRGFWLQTGSEIQRIASRFNVEVALRITDDLRKRSILEADERVVGSVSPSQFSDCSEGNENTCSKFEVLRQTHGGQSKIDMIVQVVAEQSTGGALGSLKIILDATQSIEFPLDCKPNEPI